jgi:hypothetical protein
MMTARTSAKLGLPGGRRLAAAVLACTLAGPALVAWDADAKASPQAKVSATSADAVAGVANATNPWSACPALDHRQTHNADLTCGPRTTPREHRKPTTTKTDATPRRLTTAGHWERNGLLLLRWWRSLFG